jgi:hypothetical protein
MMPSGVLGERLFSFCLYPLLLLVRCFAIQDIPSSALSQNSKPSSNHFINLFPVDHPKDPNLFAFNPENDPEISHPQLPITAEGFS